tara:strand:- start:253 stop:576 length:324 start_codon:yes stop_codon:yes gene_type:complete
MGKINLVKLEMDSMSVWVKKSEIELFKETFLDEGLVVEDTVQLSNIRPKKHRSHEEHASNILEGVSDIPSKGFVKKFASKQKVINIDGHQHLLGGNEQITDRANGLL